MDSTCLKCNMSSVLVIFGIDITSSKSTTHSISQGPHSLHLLIFMMCLKIGKSCGGHYKYYNTYSKETITSDFPILSMAACAQ